MDEARSSNAWNHTANLLLHMYRLHAKGSFALEQFHPHLQRRNRMRLKDGFDLLREAWGVQPAA